MKKVSYVGKVLDIMKMDRYKQKRNMKMESKQDKFLMISKETLLLNVYLEIIKLMKGKQ